MLPLPVVFEKSALIPLATLPPPVVFNLSASYPVAKLELAGCDVAPQKCYIDDIESWSTNEVTVNWNSALVWVSAFAADVANNGTVENPDPTPTPTPSTGADGVTVNCDSEWTLVDAVLIKQYDALIISGSNDCAVPTSNKAVYLPECDINGDGLCGFVDSVILQQCNAGVVNSLCSGLQVK